MYSEEELLPLSGLQHLLFCERRAALVLIEQQWEENLFTAEGNNLHDKVDKVTSEFSGGIRIARSLPLRSLKLGLVGKADVVEFHKKKQSENNPRLSDIPSIWQPIPIEYKRGKLRHEEGYEIQLCAQAICIEEMLGVSILYGAIYFGRDRRRLEIYFDDKLRSQVIFASLRLHELINKGVTPPAILLPKCKGCSMFDICLPSTMTGKKSVRKYLDQSINAVE